MRLLFKILLVAFILVVLLVGVVFYVGGQLKKQFGQPGTTPQQQTIGRLNLTASASQTQVYDFDGASSALVYSLVSYNTSNATNGAATMDLYTSNPLPDIYLLNLSSYCAQPCFYEDTLRSGLYNQLLFYDLLKNGATFNYISPREISSVGEGSILIVPSGLMPDYFLNSTNSSSTLLVQLLQKGVTIIYAGQDFSRSVGSQGQIYQSNASMLDNLSLAGISTSSASGPLTSNTQNLSFRKPTFTFNNGKMYGNVTYMRFNGGAGGFIIAFSNYPKSSWQSTGQMAVDLAKVINSDFWSTQLNETIANLNFTTKRGGSIGIFASIPAVPNNRSAAFTFANESYALITLAAVNSQSTLVKKFAFKVHQTQTNMVGVPSLLGESEVAPITIQLSNKTTTPSLHFDVYDANLTYAGFSIPVGIVSGSRVTLLYHAFEMPPGTYILSLRDRYNNYYGSALFNLAPVSVAPLNSGSLNFDDGTFGFTAMSNGIHVTNATANVSLNGAYTAYNVPVSSGIINYLLPRGAVITHGAQNFKFQMFGTNVPYVTEYKQAISGGHRIPPIYIEFGVAIIIVVLMNLLLKPPNIDEYYIDVSDFPPSKKEKVRVPRSSVLSVFDKVNYQHRWKYMPLTEDELKLGISNNVRYNNMQVSITMQNTQGVLAQLMQSGEVSGISNYFAPTAWTTASNHSIEYLIIFRKLRDYCVSHAILFTDIDTSNVADAIVTKEGKQLPVYIYTSNSPMRQISLSRDSKIAILFLDDAAINGFMQRLYAAVGREAEILKLGIEYNYIKLVDSNNLDQLAL